MRERTISVPTEDGQMETFITHPQEDGPFPAVVLYMDFWGVREELFDIARRVGTVGYYCMVPDFYYREGRVRHAWYGSARPGQPATSRPLDVEQRFQQSVAGLGPAGVDELLQEALPGAPPRPLGGRGDEDQVLGAGALELAPLEPRDFDD